MGRRLTKCQLTSIDVVPWSLYVEGTMSKSRPDLSALLAEVAALIHRWEEAGVVRDGWMDQAERDLEERARRRLGTGVSEDFLAARAARALRCRRPDRPSFDAFVDAVEALQSLDEWHGALPRTMGPETDLTDLQERSLKRLLVDRTGYNPSGTFGTIIPAAAMGGVDRPEKTSLVAQLLGATAYLPQTIAAGDPDDATAVTNRRVELHYVARSPATDDPRKPPGEHPIVAVAPVLQDLADADVELRTNPDRYGIRVRYATSRLEDIVKAAMAKGAHLLFMPEMAIGADQVRALASAIRRSAAAHRQASGKLPDLRFVVAGVAHASGESGNNSIVVLDLEGKRVLQQEKLCRWNLKWYHQRNYGLDPACASGAPDLREDIPGGTKVWIADLEHFGRFLTLICADMDYDKPGDWLVHNISVDWLHAPIMDKSIGWHTDKDGNLQPWIVSRAKRAGDNGVPKVIVTNSVLFTLRLNEYNARAADPNYPVLDRCAIAFMLDTRNGASQFRQIEVSLPCPDPIVESFSWMEDFVAFPPR